jgi:small subunit ribosomal protein S8
MALTDPVADFLTRIRNGSFARRRYIDVDWSKMRESIATILKNKGFILNFIIKKESPQRGKMRIFLKYTQRREPVIQGMKRASTPGRRLYVTHKQIPQFYGGLGVAVVSTSSGVMTGAEASEKGIGGELVCMIW